MDATLRADAASKPEQRRAARIPGRLPAAVAAASVLIGALQRWWVAVHAVGTLTSDGAVIGLMALQLLHHGQLTAYMWGHSYGGSLEAAPTAAVFAVARTGTSQLLATTALSSALCTLALWRAGRRIVGEPAAQLAALAFWVWPASFLWRSVKPGGTYLVGLAIALCAVRPGRVVPPDGAGVAHPGRDLDLSCRPPGRPQTAGRRCRGDGRRPSGARVRRHARLEQPAHARLRDDLLTGIPGRLGQFFPIEAPVAMGVRVDGSLAWVGGDLGEILAVAAAVALLVTAGTVVAGRAPRCVLPS